MGTFITAGYHLNLKNGRLSSIAENDNIRALQNRIYRRCNQIYYAEGKPIRIAVSHIMFSLGYKHVRFRLFRLQVMMHSCLTTG